MTQRSPKRIVLRFHERYETMLDLIVEGFFKSVDIDPQGDFFPRLYPPYDSSKAHAVLDLYSKSFASVSLDEIPYEVYRVKNPDDDGFTYNKLGYNAPNEARCRCSHIQWGTVHVYQA